MIRVGKSKYRYLGFLPNFGFIGLFFDTFFIGGDTQVCLPWYALVNHRLTEMVEHIFTLQQADDSQGDEEQKIF